MNKKRVKIKKRNNVKIIVTLIITLIFVICVIYNVIALFINPSDTFMIDNGKISTSEEANVYIIREEKLFQGENYKNGISQIKTEGQRVAKGDPIFRYYTNNEQDLVKKISELDAQIQDAMEEGNNIYSSDIAVLEKQIEDNLLLVTKTNNLTEITEYKKSKISRRIKSVRLIHKKISITKNKI